MQDFMVRKANTKDVGEVERLMTQLGYPSSSEDMNQRLEETSADPSYGTLVAERYGQVLGTLGLHAARFTVRKVARSFARWAEAVGYVHLGGAVLASAYGDPLDEQLQEFAPQAAGR